VVSIGPLILFSTQTGDAWLLDSEDGLALRLMQNGDPLPARIAETAERYMIDWNMTFQIYGNAFICQDSAGREQTILGYPAAEIRHAMGQGKAS
jgi:hypothetical protein